MKTTLAPHSQWAATVRLAESWLEDSARVQRVLPGEFDRRSAGYLQLAQTIRERRPRVDAARYLFSRWQYRLDAPWFLGGMWHLGVARRRDRHLLEGDIVLVIRANGTERQPIFTVSSKGHRIVHCYYATDRTGRNCPIGLVPIPPEYVGFGISDPDPKEFSGKVLASLASRSD